MRELEDALFVLIPLAVAGVSYWIVRAGKGRLTSLFLVPGLAGAALAALALSVVDRVPMNLVLFGSMLSCGLPALALAIPAGIVALSRRSASAAFVMNTSLAAFILTGVAFASSTAFALSESRVARILCEGLVDDLDASRLQHGFYPATLEGFVPTVSGLPLAFQLNATSLDDACGYRQREGGFELFVEGLPQSGWEYTSQRREWVYVSWPT